MELSQRRVMDRYCRSYLDSLKGMHFRLRFSHSAPRSE